MLTGEIPSLSPGCKLWMFDKGRLLAGPEKLALQGISAEHDVDRVNTESFSDGRMSQMAGEMLSAYSFCTYLVALMSQVDL